MVDSFKGHYPFRLATTSFIHRAGYAENVIKLAPMLDEIELLFLEREHLPNQAQIKELSDIAKRLDVSYNIHLPMDISLAASDPIHRRQSQRAIIKSLERAAPLDATNYTLHITYEDSQNHVDHLRKWQETAIESLSRILEKSDTPPQIICVETLDFPPLWLDPIVCQLDLSVCIDVGHIIRFGHDLRSTLSHFENRVKIYHLHGVNGQQDHLSLDYLQPEFRIQVANYLKCFQESVSLEVFSYEAFVDSMTCLAHMVEGNMTAGQGR